MLHGTFHARQLSATRFSTRCRPLVHIDRPCSRRNLLTLAIETSCDDTAVAVLEKNDHGHVEPEKVRGRAVLHFNEKITARNTGLGGIHPVEALQSHRENLAKLVSRALRFLPDRRGDGEAARAVFGEDGTVKRKPDFISVTRGPGMRSNIACGLDTAKGLSVAWQVPLLGVHHMQAHALTPRLVHLLNEKDNKNKNEKEGTKPSFPFLTLLVSGGHTMLVHSTNLTEHEIMATTQDVAIGDALDKCGRLLVSDEVKASMKDTAYAKHLSKYAFPTEDAFASWPVPTRRSEEIDKPLNRYGWQLPNPLGHTRELSFSFTSFAGAVERCYHQRTAAYGGRLDPEEHLMLARSAVGTAFEHLGSRTLIALEKLRKQDVDTSTLVVSGGVAANDFLRHYLRTLLDVRGFPHTELVFPPVELCTDNAAMVAWCGMEMFEAGFRSDLTIDALKKWSMDRASADGGILGVGGWRRTSSGTV